MPHSFNKIWIHAIWATKERQPLIEPHAEKKIHDILREELREAGCPVRIVNGMADHVHLLFLLNPQKSIAYGNMRTNLSLVCSRILMNFIRSC